MLKKANLKLVFGTSLSGYLQAPRWLLEDVLGEPHNTMASGDGKVKCSWEFIIEGKVVTIYDWKNYNGESESPDFCNWNIGSDFDEAVTAFANYLKNDCELEISETVKGNMEDRVIRVVGL